MAKFSVILAAAGKSSRFGESHAKKPFVRLGGKPIWLHSADLFFNRPEVGQLIVVVAPEDREFFIANFKEDIDSLKIDIAIGGHERADSIQNALASVCPQCDYVVIHDAARPCIDNPLIDTLFTAAHQDGAIIPAIPVHSTIKRSEDGSLVDATVDRSKLYLAQTPQVFDRLLIQSLYENRGDLQPTDEAQLAELQGHPVRLVPGSPLNIKITTRQDMELATAILKLHPSPR